MARIRSVHPGIFTDERFVQLGADAQMFLIGLWTEADDQGIFEWKPMTLRMRLRPTKDGAVEPLLAEIVAADCIKQFEIAGRQYGAIRNFRKYQRPKKPNAIHPMTEEIGIYVALTSVSSEPDEVEDSPVPSKAEMPPQMEDGGWKMEEVRNNLPAKAGAVCADDPEFEEFWKAYRPPPNSKKPEARKAWTATAKQRPAQPDLLRAVSAYNTWLAEESRKQKRDYPKQHPSTWLRGEVWNGYLSEKADPEAVATAMDRADRLLRRGKYDPQFGAVQ